MWAVQAKYPGVRFQARASRCSTFVGSPISLSTLNFPVASDSVSTDDAASAVLSTSVCAHLPFLLPWHRWAGERCSRDVSRLSIWRCTTCVKYPIYTMARKSTGVIPRLREWASAERSEHDGGSRPSRLRRI